jgi:hypothetical protein
MSKPPASFAPVGITASGLPTSAHLPQLHIRNLRANRHICTEPSLFCADACLHLRELADSDRYSSCPTVASDDRNETGGSNVPCFVPRPRSLHRAVARPGDLISPRSWLSCSRDETATKSLDQKLRPHRLVRDDLIAEVFLTEVFLTLKRGQSLAMKRTAAP